MPEESKPQKNSKRKQYKNDNPIEELLNARKAIEEEPAENDQKQENNADKGQRQRPNEETATNEPDKVSTQAPKDEDSEAPIFKVQITTSNRNLRPGSQQLKGLTDTDCYQDGGLYKYTCGSSTDYNEIYRLRKSLLDKFPEAFIIAFKNGKRTDVVQAIKEFRQNKNIKR